MVVGMFFCLWGGGAWGQQRQEHKFIGIEDDIFRFHLAPVPTEVFLTQQEVEGVVEAVLRAWGEADSRLGLELVGYSTARDSRDTHSVVPIFVTSKDDPLYYPHFGSSMPSVFNPMRARDVSTTGALLKACDIVLNAVDFRWSTQGTTPTTHMDLQSTLLRELGHCLGLVERDDDWAMLWEERGAMSISWPWIGQWRRDLNARDRADIQAYYPKGGPGARCEREGDCSGGAFCIPQQVHNTIGPRSYCTLPCAAGQGAVCPLPMSCVSSPVVFEGQWACLLPRLTDTPIGRDCQAPEDCASSSAFECLGNSAPWPQGYCSQPCGGDSWEVCPTGSLCIGGIFKCMKSCGIRGNDCRPGYSCRALIDLSGSISDDEGVCLGKCSQNSECGVGWVCRPWDGICILQQNPRAQLGDACTQHADCNAGHECWLLSGELSPATCTARCRPGEPPCPGGSSCIALEGEEGEEPLCLKHCESRQACPGGLQCAFSGPQTNKTCLPPCEVAADCPMGYTQCAEGQCLGANGEDGDGGGGGDIGTIEADKKAEVSKKSSGGCSAAGGGFWGFGYLGIGVLGWRFLRKR